MIQRSTQTIQAQRIEFRQRVVAQLQAARLFKGIPTNDLEALIEVMEPKTFAENELLFQKGDPGDSMFLILSGSVRIFTQDADQNEITLAYLEPTRIFGDFVIFDQKPRSASAVTVAPTECLVLYRDAFLNFLPQHTFVGMVMMRNVAEQVRQVTSFLSKVNGTLDQLSQGAFEEALRQLTETTSDDAALQTLVNAYVEMIHTIRQREARLSGADSPDP
jgi:CRP-like cAMP-binding protein